MFCVRVTCGASYYDSMALTETHEPKGEGYRLHNKSNVGGAPCKEEKQLGLNASIILKRINR